MRLAELARIPPSPSGLYLVKGTLDALLDLLPSRPSFVHLEDLPQVLSTLMSPSLQEQENHIIPALRPTDSGGARALPNEQYRPGWVGPGRQVFLLLNLTDGPMTSAGDSLAKAFSCKDCPLLDLEALCQQVLSHEWYSSRLSLVAPEHRAQLLRLARWPSRLRHHLLTGWPVRAWPEADAESLSHQLMLALLRPDAQSIWAQMSRTERFLLFENQGGAFSSYLLGAQQGHRTFRGRCPALGLCLRSFLRLPLEVGLPLFVSWVRLQQQQRQGYWEGLSQSRNHPQFFMFRPTSRGLLHLSQIDVPFRLDPMTVELQ